MEIKRFFAVLILLFPFTLFPCGNAPMTNFGNKIQ